MKSCIQCGTDAADDVQSCASCGRQFVYVTDINGNAPDFATPSLQQSERPDGSGALAWSKGLGIAAALFLVISLFGGKTLFAPQSDVDLLFYACLRLANALFWLALIIGLTGYVVRAISFLPGRGDNNASNQ